MHLSEGPTVRLGVDEHLREDDRNCGGGDEHIAEQLQSCRRAIRGDTAHVPNDGALRVEIGRDDGQAPSLGVFGGDPGEHGPIHISGHEFAQALIAGQPRAEEQAFEARRSDEALGDAARIELTHQAVVARAQKSKGRDHGAGAHPRHQYEFGPGPRGRPSVEHARPVRAAVAATRQSQIGRFCRAIRGGNEVGAHALDEHRLRHVGENADVRHVRDRRRLFGRRVRGSGNGAACGENERAEYHP